MAKSPVRLGIVGAGYWGPNLIRNFARLSDCQVVKVCDRKPGRLSWVHEHFPEILVTAEVGDLLADDTIEALVVATPISTHHALALEVLKAGKHLFVEKPLAGSSAQAREIAQLADQRGLILATGHVYVYHPAIVAMQQELASGRLGEACYAESTRANLGPPAAEVSVIWDLAVHDVAVLLYLFGTAPVEVTAYGRRFVHPSEVDAAFVHLRFADGRMAQHHVSWLSSEKVRRFTVACTRGSLKFDEAAAEKLRVLGPGIDTRVGARDDKATDLTYGVGEVQVPTLESVEPLQAECAHFVDCVRRRARPRADGWAGLEVVRVLEAAERSVVEGSRPVALQGQ